MSAKWPCTESGSNHLVPNILREDQTKPFINENEVLKNQLNKIQAENNHLKHLLKQEFERHTVCAHLHKTPEQIGKVQRVSQNKQTIDDAK